MSSVRNFLFLHVFTALLPPKYGDGDDDGTGNGPPDRRDYYDILGLKRRPSPTHQQIRKAYKKKSLELHPDKIAQRRQQQRGQPGGGNDVDVDDDPAIKREFELVREAYGCLIDAEHRRQYHQLGCSNARYKFVVLQHGLYQPTAVLHNVTRSSCADKTRLVALLTALVLLALVQPVLIAAKVNQIAVPEWQEQEQDDRGTLADVPWTLILIPLWVFQGLILAVLATLIGLIICSDDDETTRKKRTTASASGDSGPDAENGGDNNGDDNEPDKGTDKIGSDNDRRTIWIPLVLLFLEHSCWIIGNWFLALRWDQNELLLTWSWHVISIPYYCGLFFRIVSSAYSVKRTQHLQSTMVSPERMSQLIIAEQRKRRQNSGNGGDDTAGDSNIDEDEIDDAISSELERKYTVITVDEEAVASTVHVLRMEIDLASAAAGAGGGTADFPTIEEEDIEQIRVQLSQEYIAADGAVRQQFNSTTLIVLCGIPFVALVACRLLAQISASWWVVFVPVWFYFFVHIIKAFYHCCCYASNSDEPIIFIPQSGGDGENEDAVDEGNRQHRQMGEGEEQRTGEASSATIANDGVKASVVFASAEGPIGEFNEASGRSEEESIQVSTSQANEGVHQQVPDSQKSSEKADTDGKADSRPDRVEEKKDSVEVPNCHGSAATGIAPTKGNAGVSNLNNDSNDVILEDEDDPNIRIDEETFYAWRRAQEESETSTLERQAKAQSSCCWASFQLIIVCLIVGKLEQDFDSDDLDPGYNAFWILFPIFLVMGVLLCCCCCLVYGAGPTGFDDMVDRAGHERDGEEEHPPSGESSARAPGSEERKDENEQQEGKGQQGESTNQRQEKDEGKASWKEGHGNDGANPAASSAHESAADDDVETGTGDMNDLD